MAERFQGLGGSSKARRPACLPHPKQSLSVTGQHHNLGEASLLHPGALCLYSSLSALLGRQKVSVPWAVSTATVLGKRQGDHLFPFWEVLSIPSLEPQVAV